MDPLSFIVIFFLFLALVIVATLPLIMGIPFYRFVLAKFRKDTIIFTLTPSKEMEMMPAATRSSLLKTRKKNMYFLNTPDAIYNMFGIPVAVAYHKYGAILPPRNIIHATHMKDLGFYNIGEVVVRMDELNTHIGLLVNEKSKISDESGMPNKLFEITEEGIKEEFDNEKASKRLMLIFKGNNIPFTTRSRVIKGEKGWVVVVKKQKYFVEEEKDGILIVYDKPEIDIEEQPEIKEKLKELDEQIQSMYEELTLLEQTQIEESGIIRIQDIFNFMNKNLSTDVIFSIIERSVAEEIKDMRDHFGKFQQMLPTILVLIIVFVISYVIITSGGGSTIQNIGQGLSGVVPNMGGP